MQLEWNGHDALENQVTAHLAQDSGGDVYRPNFPKLLYYITFKPSCLPAMMKYFIKVEF